MSVIEKDIVIIGAGIVGTTIAERLSYEGLSVCMIDRLEPGHGCSKGHAGHFATDIVLPLANFKTILSVPKLLMDPLGPLSIRWGYFPKLFPWLLRFMWAAMPHKTKATSEALIALNRPSIEAYTELLKRNELEHLMVKRGALTIYEKEASQLGHQATVALLREYGVTLDVLSGDQLRDLEPVICSKVHGGLFFPNTAHTVDPLALVSCLSDKVFARENEFLKAEVREIEANIDGTVNLKTESNTIRAKKVIISCGAWSKHLVKMTGYSVPLETERGYHLMLPEPQVNLSRPVTSFERSFVMTPMNEGLRLAGTVELGGLEAPMNEARADILYEHAVNLLPGLDRSNATKWMGFRPSLPDSLPVIDRSKKHSSIYYAFGHQHLGLTQAAVTAELMAGLVMEQPMEIDMTPFKVDRF